MPGPRHEPVRTCVACREEAGKGAMVRIVRQVGGAAVDPTGHAPGRGAYLHATGSCIDVARKKKALERALKTAVSQEIWTEIAETSGSRPAP